jgi:hypothetical protein
MVITLRICAYVNYFLAAANLSLFYYFADLKHLVAAVLCTVVGLFCQNGARNELS